MKKTITIYISRVSHWPVMSFDIIDFWRKWLMTHRKSRPRGSPYSTIISPGKLKDSVNYLTLSKLVII